LSSRAIRRSIFIACIVAVFRLPLALGGDEFPLIPHDVCQQLIHHELLVSTADPRILRAYPHFHDDPSYGTCGPVCAYNLVRVLEVETRTQILRNTDPAAFVQEIEPYIETGQDILKGVSPEVLSAALKDFFKARKSARDITLHAYGSTTGISEDLFLDPGKLHLIMLWQKSERVGHYLLVKNINRAKQMMHVLDPNYPTQILKLQYQRVQVRNSPDRIQVHGPLAEIYFGKSRAFIDTVIQVSKTPLPREPFRIQNLWRRSK